MLRLEAVSGRNGLRCDLTPPHRQSLVALPFSTRRRYQGTLLRALSSSPLTQTRADSRRLAPQHSVLQSPTSPVHVHSVVHQLPKADNRIVASTLTPRATPSSLATIWDKWAPRLRLPRAPLLTIFRLRRLSLSRVSLTSSFFFPPCSARSSLLSSDSALPTHRAPSAEPRRSRAQNYRHSHHHASRMIRLLYAGY